MSKNFDFDKEDKINLNELKFFEVQNGDKFAAKVGLISPHIGAEKIGCNLTVLETGKRAYPFHAHHVNEEMFIILKGEGNYRMGDKEFKISEGDIISAPAGEGATAHQIYNDSNYELRYLAISTRLDPEVVEYPDSHKFMVVSRIPEGGSFKDAAIRYIGKVENSLDYWDDE